MYFKLILMQKCASLYSADERSTALPFPGGHLSASCKFAYLLPVSPIRTVVTQALLKCAVSYKKWSQLRAGITLQTWIQIILMASAPPLRRCSSLGPPPQNSSEMKSGGSRVIGVTPAWHPENSPVCSSRTWFSLNGLNDSNVTL